MTVLLIGILLGLLGLLALLLDNLRHFKRLPPAPLRSPEDALPRVSVLVPARDEERAIATCLASLRAQPGLDLEIRVLDDGSSDRTAEIVRGIAAEDPRVTLMTGAALPEGWKGKPHACQQLGAAAKGDWLLFVDADVTLEPGAIAAAVAMAEADGADLLSVYPEQVTVTLPEKIVLPTLGFILVGFLPFRFLGYPDPRIAAANGQFMLFRRAAYAAIGGHAGVKTAIVEDIELARAIKRAGLRLAVADGTRSVRCRMYRNLPEIWNGFSKNLYPAFGGQPAPFWFSMALLGIFFVAPYFLLGQASVRGLAAAAIALALVMRLLLALRLRQSPWAVLGHPLAMLFTLAVGLRSYQASRSGRTIPWKGRTYNS